MLKILKQLGGNPSSPLSPLCCELNKQWSAALVQRYFNSLILATGWCTPWLGPLRMHYAKFAGKGNNPFIVVFFLFTALLLPSLAHIMPPPQWNLQIWSCSGCVTGRAGPCGWKLPIILRVTTCTWCLPRHYILCDGCHCIQGYILICSWN